MTDFDDAIEQLYRAFSHVPPPPDIPGCHHCVPDAEIAVLLATPLRNLTPHELANYASSVTLTVGGADDLRYFLPRLLEIIVVERYWWPDIEQLFGTLQRANWQQWDQVEVAGIIDFAQNVFATLLATAEPTGAAIDAWICALGRGGLDLQPFLRQLQAPSAQTKLVEYYEVNSEKLMRGRLSNGYWRDVPETKQMVIEWFQSPAVATAIWKAYGMA